MRASNRMQMHHTASLRLAVNLIKVQHGASTEGLPHFSANLHGRRWMITLTARVILAFANSSIWLNIDINTKKRGKQGDTCRYTYSHWRKTLRSLFFFIAQMQIKDIHQVRDRPGQVTDNRADLVAGLLHHVKVLTLPFLFYVKQLLVRYSVTQTNVWWELLFFTSEPCNYNHIL